MSRQFLICSDADHAAAVDLMVLEHLREVDGAHGSAWSAIYTDGNRYAIAWGQPVEAVFGAPADDPSLVVVADTNDTQGSSIWSICVPPTPDAPL